MNASVVVRNKGSVSLASFQNGDVSSWASYFKRHLNPYNNVEKTTFPCKSKCLRKVFVQRLGHTTTAEVGGLVEFVPYVFGTRSNLVKK